MNAALLPRLLKLHVKSSIGFFRSDDAVSIVEAARTPLGLGSIRSQRIPLDDTSASSTEAVREILADLMQRESTKTVTVGIRSSAVDFVADLAREEEQWDGETKPSKQAASKKALEASVLIDSLAITAARTKYVLTGRVRAQEIRATLPEDGDEEEEFVHPRYEPGPWAAWRASNHFAPLRPRSGVHLRYILGATTGLAILGDKNWPLAWQLLSWKRDAKGSALIQAYHMLALYGRRRLSLAEIPHVSVQGDHDLSEGWGIVETALGREVEVVKGPCYDAEFVALGLALGGLEQEERTLDLGRALRPPRSILSMLPRGELGFLCFLFASMFVALWGHSLSLRADLREAMAENAASSWATAISASQLKNERVRLLSEVQPLSRFLTRNIAFAPVVAAIAQNIPEKAWLESLHGVDLVWQRASNAGLGNSYVLLRYGAPLVRRGTVPVEMDQLVKGLRASSYIKESLPEVKLSDINWKREGEAGVTVFTVTATPKTK